MFLVGLTGGISTGKSTVSNIFKNHGIPVIDADLIAREVVEPGQPAYHKLREEFGSEIFDDENGGVLIREKLGQLVFSNQQIRHKVNGITHPEIRKRIFVNILRCFLNGERYVILDTPLLFEVGYDKIVQKIIVVYCDEEQQLKRLKERDGCSDEAAQQRINAQMKLTEKCHKATHILDNSKDVDHTRYQVEKLIQEFDASYLPAIIRFIIVLIIMIIVGIAYLIARMI